MAGIFLNSGLEYVLDQGLPNTLKVGLFCNSTDFANYAAVDQPDVANGYAEQTPTWSAAVAGGGSGSKSVTVTFAHTGAGNFTNGAQNPADIYGVYVSDGVDVSYHNFPTVVNIGPTYSAGKQITITFTLA